MSEYFYQHNVFNLALVFRRTITILLTTKWKVEKNYKKILREFDLRPMGANERLP